MLNILEVLNTYDDKWRMTFYFVAALAILIGFFWTYYQMYKNEDKNKKSSKEKNAIYDHPMDILEDIDLIPIKRKEDTSIQNYYDVYQTENKKRIASDKDELIQENYENKIEYSNKSGEEDIKKEARNENISKNLVKENNNDDNNEFIPQKMNTKSIISGEIIRNNNPIQNENEIKIIDKSHTEYINHVKNKEDNTIVKSNFVINNTQEGRVEYIKKDNKENLSKKYDKKKNYYMKNNKKHNKKYKYYYNSKKKSK